MQAFSLSSSSLQAQPRSLSARAAAGSNAGHLFGVRLLLDWSRCARGPGGSDIVVLAYCKCDYPEVMLCNFVMKILMRMLSFWATTHVGFTQTRLQPDLPGKQCKQGLGGNSIYMVQSTACHYTRVSSRASPVRRRSGRTKSMMGIPTSRIGKS